LIHQNEYMKIWFDTLINDSFLQYSRIQGKEEVFVKEFFVGD